MVTDMVMVTAMPMLTFTGTRARIGTAVASTGMRPCAAVGGAVVGTAMAKVAAGDGHRAATFGFAAKH